MRSEDEIQAKFDELVLQRDKCKKGSAARKILNDNVRALAWVLHHPGPFHCFLIEGAIGCDTI